MQRTSRTRYALLGFLTWRPMSGYDVKKAVEQSTANFWSESYGQIYPILQDLVRQGLAQRTAAAAGGRERYVYSITPKGRRELRRWLAEPTAPATVRNETLLKLFFGSQVDAATHRRQLDRLRREVVALSEHLAALRALLEANAAERDASYWLITLRFGEIQARAQMQWLDEALSLCDELEKTEKKRGRLAASRTRRSPAATPRRRRTS